MNSTVTTSSNPSGLNLQVTGMTCASCVMRVEKSLKSVPGVLEVNVNLATEQAFVDAAPSVSAEALVAAVRKAGYDASVEEVILQIEGMTCASCVARVEKVLLKVPGVLSASVNLATERATVQALSTVSAFVLKGAVEKAGYGATDLQTARSEQAKRLPDWWPVALGAALTLPLLAPMLLQMIGIDWMPGPWIQLALATPVQFGLGWRFYRAASHRYSRGDNRDSQNNRVH